MQYLESSSSTDNRTLSLSSLKRNPWSREVVNNIDENGRSLLHCAIQYDASSESGGIITLKILETLGSEFTLGLFFYPEK